ncbi:hypothetical protein Psch_03598 [Pelotomaculum schinkii]|uniref:Uncharacterized protein n=1 Tax=Pelotomaculum schinkii TaxID=78350 RepID=A0A4Y7R7T6_9FIRM|nr:MULTISPECIES: hypothetical protein [Pelotomaculum]TEB04836.1 hypothetical protein Psch_03598 [Pelotomaculum schinkii]TEB13976.1 hypothetical protein Psfp_03246 [Pelotomaculum sp. FP]
MQIKISQKHNWICLFLCGLLLIGYISMASPHNIFSVDAYALDRSSISGGPPHSSMDGGINLWYIDYSAITNTRAGFFLSSVKPFLWLHTKNIFYLLTSLITAQIISFLYSSRLAGRLGAQFRSIGITIFLHKKDGMK